MNNIYEIKDLKATTMVSLYHSIQSVNNNEIDPSSEKELRIVFVTDFGYISPDEIIPSKSDIDEFTDDNIPDWIFQTSIDSRNELLDEFNNTETREELASFILKNVLVIPHNGTKHTLRNLILFSDKLIGAFVADLDFLENL